MRKLVTLIAVLSLTASMGLFSLNVSAETGQWKLILVTVTDHFDPQWGSFETLRECVTEGALLLHDQELYLGFGCVYWGGE